MIASYYNNIGRQAVQDKLARAVMEKLLEWEAAEGLPLFIFTARSLLEAGPDVCSAQQYFPDEAWEKPWPGQKARNKFPNNQKIRNTTMLYVFLNF